MVVRRGQLLSEVDRGCSASTRSTSRKYGRDRIQDGDEDFLHTGIRFNVTRQGFLNFSHGRGHETWQGTKYKIGSDFNFFGNMQALRWLNLSGNYGGGPAIFYDEIDPFQGRSRSYNIETTVQPNQHLSQNLEFSRVRFSRPATGARRLRRRTSSIRGRRISSTSTSWCGSWRSTTARSDRVLTDFLASYEFVPGTVFHVGYGSLYEKGFGSVEPVPGGVNPADPSNRYLMINRGLFLKASYLRRF